jgi:hypothetical protein
VLGSRLLLTLAWNEWSGAVGDKEQWKLGFVAGIRHRLAAKRTDEIHAKDSITI